MNVAREPVSKLAFTVKELAAASTLSEAKIRKDIRNGVLPRKKKGSRTYILFADAMAYLECDDDEEEEEE